MKEPQNGHFWETKSLAEMTPKEWESLCDGCGRCCLYKLEDEDSGDILQTNVVCRFLDLSNCRCTTYPRRHKRVPTCVLLSPDKIAGLKWIPESCAYRLLAEGKELPDWHPLLSGDPESVYRAGVSVRGWSISESEIDMDRLEDYVVDPSDDER
ncbi:MAG: YcgN family cysteine cluster protein [Chloroflexi bacterium]|nr:YcgN family cysteine cluster protein [Chloroflexota bacterium]